MNELRIESKHERAVRIAKDRACWMCGKVGVIPYSRFCSVDCNKKASAMLIEQSRQADLDEAAAQKATQKIEYEWLQVTKKAWELYNTIEEQQVIHTYWNSKNEKRSKKSVDMRGGAGRGLVLSRPRYERGPPKSKEEIIREQQDHFERHKKCYRKEAKAIIYGRHWEGKNKCVTLKGD